MTDAVQKFLFDDLDIRGAIVQLDSTWKAILRNRDYPESVRDLLGELCAVTTIVAANLKTPGRITLQLKGQGPVSLLVVDCSGQLNLRGFAQAEAQPAGSSVEELLGDGNLLMTVDSGEAQQPYQSFVPLDGATIAEVFQSYLEQSEQSPAAIFLAADGDKSAGLFLQKLPRADERDPDGWNRICGLAETVTAGELLSLDPATLLLRLFSEEVVRVFDPLPATHVFPPDWDKVRTTLRALGREELDSIIEEKGEIVVRDDLSNNEYRFDADAVDALFSEPPPTLH